MFNTPSSQRWKPWQQVLSCWFVLLAIHLVFRVGTIYFQRHSVGFVSGRQVLVGLANDAFFSSLIVPLLAIASVGRERALGWVAVAIPISLFTFLTCLLGGNFVNVVLTGNNLSFDEISYLNARDFPDLIDSGIKFLAGSEGLYILLGFLVLAAVMRWVGGMIARAIGGLKTTTTSSIVLLVFSVIIPCTILRSYALSSRLVLYEPVETHVLPFLAWSRAARLDVEIGEPVDGIAAIQKRLVEGGARLLPEPFLPMRAWRNFHTSKRSTLGDAPILPAKTNVVIILLESFGSTIAERFPEAMPKIPELLARGLSLKSHFTTAFRTVGAQYSVLCSQHNPSAFYVSRQYPKTELRCLPRILKEQGYATYWVTGTSRMGDYDEEWLTRNGFDHATGEEDFSHDIERFSYGVHDGPVFRRLLETLDRAPEPFFTYAVTISAHHPFIVPVAHLKAHPEIAQLTNVEQAFHYASTSLTDFLNRAATRPWSKNTLFLLFGDHSAWAYEGGSPTDPDYRRTRERYHVLTSFLHPNLKPATVSLDTSHIDLAPTILDLLNIQAVSDFMGTSIYALKEPVLVGSQENSRDTYWVAHDRERVIYRGATGRTCQMARRGDPDHATACDAKAWRDSDEFKAMYFDTVQWQVIHRGLGNP